MLLNPLLKIGILSDSMSLTIQFAVFVVDAVLGTPVFSSPQGDYGIQRVDTRALIRSDGTELVAAGDQWTYALDGAEDDVVYRYYIEVNADGTTYHVPRTTNFVADACLVVSRYTDSIQLESQFSKNGEEMIKWLSAGDNESPTEYGRRIQYFQDRACDDVDDDLRGAITVPITGTVPAKIASLATIRSGLLAYESSGTIDTDANGFRTHRYAHLVKYYESEIAKIKSGRTRLYIDERKAYMTVGEE